MEAVALYDLVAAAGMPIGSMEAAALSTLPADWAALQAAVADAVAERDQEVADCQRELDSGEPPVHRALQELARPQNGSDVLVLVAHHTCQLARDLETKEALCMQRRSLRARR